MHSRRQHRKNNLFSGKTVLVLFLAIVVFAVASLNAEYFRQKTAFLTDSIWQARDNALSGAASFFSSAFYEKDELIEENKELQRKIDELSSLEAKNRALERENRYLASFFALERQKPFVLAPVKLKPPFGPSGIIIADSVGAAVEADALAFDEFDNPVGKVSSANENDIRIVLFSAGGRKTQAFLETGEMVSLEGRGGGGFVFELPKGAEVRQGDLIYLEESLPLAEVVDIEESKNDPFIKIFLRSLSSANQLVYVGVEI